MLISVNQFRSWLKDSAKTLREGGATATAAVYEEIADELAVATCDIRAACEDQVKDAEEKAGAVPLPPMLIARNMAARKGIINKLNILENPFVDSKCYNIIK